MKAVAVHLWNVCSQSLDFIQNLDNPENPKPRPYNRHHNITEGPPRDANPLDPFSSNDGGLSLPAHAAAARVDPVSFRDQPPKDASLHLIHVDYYFSPPPTPFFAGFFFHLGTCMCQGGRSGNYLLGCGH